MKDFKIQLEAYTSNLIVWTILLITMGLMIANIVTIFNMMAVVETMWVEIEQGEGAQWWPAVGNLGCRPTFEQSEIILEVHILDFSQDIYGKRLRTRFVQYIRPEQRFKGLEALKGQITKDIAKARKILKISTRPDANSSMIKY